MMRAPKLRWARWVRVRKLLPIIAVAVGSRITLFHAKRRHGRAKQFIRVKGAPRYNRIISPYRAFPLWKESPGNPLPCIIDDPPLDEPDWHPLDRFTQRQPSAIGILMVKIDKAGSTTLAGVAARIAHALARNKNAGARTNLTSSQRVCRCRISHIWSKQTKRVSDRDKARSFLFTMVRDPSKRAMSEFFHFRVARKGVKASEDNVVKHLQGVRNFQLGLVVDRVKTRSVKFMTNRSRLNAVVQDVLNEYNFIGALERLEESLVLLKLILGLKTRDVLYLSAKKHGSFDPFQKKCKLIPSSFTTPKINEYLSSNEWIENNKGDHALYKAVNRSLDLTIKAIGRKRFRSALSNFRKAQALANEKCEATLPCKSEGVWRPENESKCYWSDSGCGYPCLDRLFQNNTLGSSVSTAAKPKIKKKEDRAAFILSSRAFPRWKDSGHPLPCIIDAPPENESDWHPLDEVTQKQPTKYGLLMVKIDKAGSSTLAGVAARIAHAMASRPSMANSTTASRMVSNLTAPRRVCRCRISHAWSLATPRLSNRDRARSFLFTMVRDPARRAVSEFFHFRVGMAGMEASDDNAINHLRGVRNFQLGFVVDGNNRVQTMERLKARGGREIDAVIQGVLDEFDFIGTLERLDESLVLLQLILGLETRDVLYLSAKRSGSYMLVTSRANDYRGECKLIPSTLKMLSPTINDYLSSDEWRENNKGDQALYDAVNRSLDRTIESIGRSRFRYALSKFRKKQALATEECPATLPCTAGGTVRPENERNCYWLDAGCNYPCLDELFPTSASAEVRKRRQQQQPNTTTARGRL